MNTKLSRAAALRPTSELEQLLGVLERRIGFYRSKTLSLVAVRAAIQNELCLREAVYRPACTGKGTRP